MCLCHILHNKAYIYIGLHNLAEYRVAKAIFFIWS